MLIRRIRRTALLLVAVCAVVAVAVLAVRQIAERLGPAADCTARVSGATAHVDLEQADNAATISAVAARRGLPARAATIALATALQESKLLNLDYGDRDSLGLFQQRPSQGWGTPKQILDPTYAAGRFFDALVKIDGYQTMDIGAAAQLVQRSGYPGAYAKREPKARALASALMGYSPAAFTCNPRESAPPAQEPGSDGRTPRADAAVAALNAAFGAQKVAQPGASAARTVEVGYPTADPGSRRAGWASAQWLIAKAAVLHVAQVAFDGQIWRAAQGPGSWQSYQPTTGGSDGASGTTDGLTLLRDKLQFDVS